MNILINGINGHMGREVRLLCESGYRDSVLACGVDPTSTVSGEIPVYNSFAEISDDVSIDCIIDFSHHAATEALLEYATKRHIPTVICTTGHTDAELLSIRRASGKIPIFFSANMSLGVALLVELAKTVALAMPEAEIEIIEKHHDRKIDAPSGTALLLANAIKEVREKAFFVFGRGGQSKRTEDEIGIHSLRMGNVVGEHEVIIGTPNQTLTLKHEAHSRALFAEGALTAARFVLDMPLGLYDMPRMLSAINERE